MYTIMLTKPNRNQEMSCYLYNELNLLSPLTIRIITHFFNIRTHYKFF